jgi:5-methylcytosine-specific restriction endonuclease McrA
MSIKVGKLGRVRLKGADLERLRRACFVRDGYRCVICGRTVGWVSGHMMHIQGRGAFGSDVLSNVETGCAECHHHHHNPKAVPRKATSYL